LPSVISSSPFFLCFPACKCCKPSARASYIAVEPPGERTDGPAQQFAVRRKILHK
jgi:hypothetical protein